MNGRGGNGGSDRRAALAIVYATLAEAQPLLDRLAARPLTDRPYAAYVAAGAPRLVIAITGMGLAAASAGIAALLARERPQGVVNAGIAGALHGGHALGAVLRVGAVAECEGDTLTAEAFCALDHAALDWLAPAAPAARLISRATPLFDARLRDRLARSADLVDMEGARIAAGCREARVPCALLKAVSDRATDRATLHANLAHGARRLAEVLAPPLLGAC